MIIKIENRKYEYRGNNICSVTATLNIYQNDATNIIGSTELSSNFDISNVETVIQEINMQIGTQINEYLTKLQYIDSLRQQIFPNSTDFNSAIDSILDPIQNSLIG